MIAKKRDGQRLTPEEIQFFIDSYMSGETADYQAAALLMAIYLRGMDDGETQALTLAMARSGQRVDLSDIPGVKVDKHSTGGVGDKTSIALIPLVASAGVPVAKMSGRGLGHTGGTIDKLESIPGFRTDLSVEQFKHNVRTVGAAIIGQTEELAPADKMLYALRDVTATIESVPLIASSIMSKKLAGGADKILLDVKWGEGAFMKRAEDAVQLAKTMVAVGNLSGVPTRAVVTDMNAPLGRTVGNSLEVMEAISVLKGQAPEDLSLLVRYLGSIMLTMAMEAVDLEAAGALIDRLIQSGKACETLERVIAAQGGRAECVNNPSLLPVAREQRTLLSDKAGWVSRVSPMCVGRTAMSLGAGRRKKGDNVDLSVGIVLLKKPGDAVERGEPLARIYGATPSATEDAMESLATAFFIQDEPPSLTPLIYQEVQ